VAIYKAERAGKPTVAPMDDTADDPMFADDFGDGDEATIH
jgi:hypothetical protein